MKLFLLAAAVVIVAMFAVGARADCWSIPGHNTLYVVALTTLADQEKAANPSYNGNFAPEGVYFYRGYKMWEEVVNNGTGIKVGNQTWCVNMTIANSGADGSIADGTVAGKPLGRTRELTRLWTNGTYGPIFGGKTLPDVFFGPYSSTLTVPFALETEPVKVISLNPGASSRTVYRCSKASMDAGSQPDCVARGAADGARRFRYLHGVQPPANNNAFPAVTLMRLRDVKTLVTWYEDQPFTKSIVDGAVSAAAFNKINITGAFKVSMNPTDEEVYNMAVKIKELNPDAVIGGTYYTSCKPFIKALRQLNWTPKAFFSSLCTASRPESVTELQGDERYIIDYLEWDHRLLGPDYVDSYYFTNTTIGAPQQFYDLHMARWGQPPFHFTALAFSLGTVVHQLLQSTGGVDQESWRQALGSFLITSYSGKISFDGWGQNPSRDVIMEQRDANSVVQVLYPLGAATGEIVYPIPKFEERVFDVNYLGLPVETALAALAGVLMFFSLVLLVFVIVNHKNPWIFASAPVFLCFILIGSLLQYSTIFAWAKQATGASCILRFWLLVLGFVLMFGALFSKTYRVARIFSQKKLVVMKISNSEVGVILGAAVSIAAVLLALWTGIARPQPTYGNFDVNRPANTIYSCTYTTADLAFLILIMLYVGSLIITGIYLSAKIWNIPAKVFNEAKQIGFSMYNMFFFLVICFGLQVSNVIEPNSMFVLRSLCILLSTFITVVTIFAPKVLAVLGKKDYKSNSSTLTRSTLSVTTLTSAGSTGSEDTSTQLKDTQKALNKAKRDLAEHSRELKQLKLKYQRMKEKTGFESEPDEGSQETESSDNLVEPDVPTKKTDSAASPEKKRTKKPAASAPKPEEPESSTSSSSSSSSEDEEPPVAKEPQKKKSAKPARKNRE